MRLVDLLERTLTSAQACRARIDAERCCERKRCAPREVIDEAVEAAPGGEGRLAVGRTSGLLRVQVDWVLDLQTDEAGAAPMFRALSTAQSGLVLVSQDETCVGRGAHERGRDRHQGRRRHQRGFPDGVGTALGRRGGAAKARPLRGRRRSSAGAVDPGRPDSDAYQHVIGIEDRRSGGRSARCAGDTRGMDA